MNKQKRVKPKPFKASRVELPEHLDRLLDKRWSRRASIRIDIWIAQSERGKVPQVAA